MISTKRSHHSRDASYWCTLPRSIVYRSLYTRRCKSNCHLYMLTATTQLRKFAIRLAWKRERARPFLRNDFSNTYVISL